jgi:alpha-glutamyl/putrescinyl thymine pyrophosphorylase clade 1
VNLQLYDSACSDTAVTSKRQASKALGQVRHKNARGTAQLDLLAGRTITSCTPLSFVRSALPRPTDVFATYWRFAKVRQDAFFARFSILGSSVEDSVIKRHRFTNVYRGADRVSQYLIRHVLYDQAWSPTDLVFRLLMFKFFNKIETWEALEQTVGTITWDNYHFETYSRCLDRTMVVGQRVYSAAYIMPSGATAFGYKRKHQNHLKVIETMITAGLPERLMSSKSFQAVFQLLCSFPTIGPFIGYQFAIDLNYSTLACTRFG